MSFARSTVLIGGGTGFIGSAVARMLRRKGYNVTIISRNPEAYQPHVTWAQLELNGLPPNVSAVVNAAGQNVFDARKAWTPVFKQDVCVSRINTTQLLARVIDAADAVDKPKVFISMSGVGYYPPSKEAEYTEESPGGNFDFLSKLATDWERSTEMEKSPTVRRVIMRSGVVLGREGGVVKQMYWPFWFFGGGPVGSGKQIFPWIHLHDLVGFMIYAIENDEVSGIFNGVAPQIITNKEFSSALAKAMWRTSLFPIPVFLLKWLFSEERAKMMTEGQKVIPKRILESGYTYKYPHIGEACKEVARMIYVDDLIH